MLLSAVLDERRADHRDAEQADQPRGPRAHHLLVDDRLAHDVGALAAVLARPGERQIAGLVDLPLPGLGLGDAARVAELDRALVALALGDVPLEPGPDLALEGQLLGRVREIHGRVGSTSPPGWLPSGPLMVTDPRVVRGMQTQLASWRNRAAGSPAPARREVGLTS